MNKLKEAIIKRYLGTPFKHQGRFPLGLDCWTFVLTVYRWELGKDLLTISCYCEDWAKEGKNYFVENYHKQWKEVDQPKMFDVILFKNAAGVVSHCGLYLENNEFIHCEKRNGVIVSKLDKWQDKIQGYYTLK